MKNPKRFLSFVLALSMLLALDMTAFAAADDIGFTDVAPDADYARAVAWCYEEGLMQGVSSTSFAPDATLTRAMVATVLYRAAGEPTVSGAMAFTDTQTGQWYSDAILWAGARGIVQGYGNGLLGTNDPVTLEQLDVMICRYNGEDPVWTGDPSLSIAATRSRAATAFYNNLRTEKSRKVLVAYFSASGNTENVAKVIADTLDADLFEMIPETPYTSDDLNWTDPGSRVNAEHNDPARQEIKLTKTAVDSWADYDTVFIGYPLWWRAAAWPVNEFVKNNDFTGKTVIPFCTSTSDGLGQSGELLAEMAAGGDWQEGRRFSERAAQPDIAAWVKGLGLW